MSLQDKPKNYKIILIQILNETYHSCEFSVVESTQNNPLEKVARGNHTSISDETQVLFATRARCEYTLNLTPATVFVQARRP